MSKIFFLFSPGTYTDVPPLGPALMQAVAMRVGYESKFLDLNLDLHLKSKSYPKLKNLKELEYKKLTYSDIKNYLRLFKLWFKHIQEYDPDWIGLSVFTYKSHKHAKLFLKCLKKQKHNYKIVIGGAGVIVPSEEYPNYPSYGYELLSEKLIDYYISGEGEAALSALLCGDISYPGINSEQYKSLEDFKLVPTPNFDSFLLDQYQSFDLNDRFTLSVEGSRGCVRNCTFCDIKKVWKKYKFKDGNKLANELLELSEKHNIRNFWFNDSLINGSTSAYRHFIKTLADYNSSVDSGKQIKWSSQFILKSITATPREDIELTKLSGGHNLAIGIESGSYAVRKHMGKNFTDKDIEHTFDLMREFDIKIFLLMLIGYPTETESDYQETLDFFKKYKNLALEGTITGLVLGQTLEITPGTPLDDMQEDLGIKLEKTKRIFWVNGNSDLNTRIHRRVEAEEYVRQLGYNFYDSTTELKYFKKLLEYHE